MNRPFAKGIEGNSESSIDNRAILGMLDGFFVMTKGSGERFFCIYDPTTGIEAKLRGIDYIFANVKKFNATLRIGYGYTHGGYERSCIYCVPVGTDLQVWKDILRYEFGSIHDPWFASTNRFGLDFSVNGWDCHALFRYFPSYYKNLTSQQRSVQRSIYDFKDGGHPELWAKVFALSIRKLPLYKKHKDNCLVVPVPASTIEKHRRRYVAFSEHLSKYLKVYNGLDGIIVYADRAEKKGKTFEWEDMCNTSCFDVELMKDKDIILLDDVITRGSTFSMYAKVLMVNGARSVTGVFMGKTAHLDEHGELVDIVDYNHEVEQMRFGTGNVEE